MIEKRFIVAKQHKLIIIIHDPCIVLPDKIAQYETINFQLIINKDGA